MADQAVSAEDALLARVNGDHRTIPLLLRKIIEDKPSCQGSTPASCRNALEAEAGHR